MAVERTPKYRTEIQQMMFVSGETGEPSVETTTIIEEIVQNQVKEMLKRATESANRRGVRTIAIDDLMFLIRSDKAKVSRLQSFLSWKDVRKTAKDSDEKPGGGDDFVGGPDDATAAAGSGASADMAARGMNRNRRTKVKLPWDVSGLYNVQLPEREDEAENDEEEEEMTSATLERLKNADERTRDMTREEYVHWSECRQASFTFRKGKRFREWAGFGDVTDSKPNDDIIDILGFLTFEIVQTLTEDSLKVKAEEEKGVKLDGASKGGGDASKGINKRTLEDDGDEEDGDENRGVKKRGDASMVVGVGLFDAPNEERLPVQPWHVQEAFRRSQRPPKKMKPFGSFHMRTVRQPLRLI